MNKRIVHDALVLFAFTVVLGLLLAVVYGITKAPIEKVNYEKTQAAYKQVFEDADSFEAYADFDADAANDLVAENGFPMKSKMYRWQRKPAAIHSDMLLP